MKKSELQEAIKKAIKEQMLNRAPASGLSNDLSELNSDINKLNKRLRKLLMQISTPEGQKELSADGFDPRITREKLVTLIRLIDKDIFYF
jgi:Spy/CpxP family protein refolding chaperone